MNPDDLIYKEHSVIPRTCAGCGKKTRLHIAATLPFCHDCMRRLQLELGGGK